VTLETEVTALRATLEGLPPAEAARLTSIWGSLTVKRRRWLLAYLQTGNASEAARRTYNVTTPNSAAQVGKELLEDPKVSYCVQALLEAEGVSPAKLRAIHAHHLAGFDSAEPGDRDRSLRATALAYKYVRPPQTARAGIAGRTTGDIFDGWTSAELAAFAERKIVPRRFASRFIANLTHSEPSAIPPPAAKDVVRAPVADPRTAQGRAADDRVAPEDRQEAAHTRTVGSEPRSTCGTPAVAAPGYESCREEIARQERELRRATHEPVDPAWRDMALRDRRW
jgi:hypothetical protein